MTQVNRRVMLGGTLAAGTVAALTACSANSSSTSSASASAAVTPTGKLALDTSAFTEKTVTVSTRSGDVEVTYKFYGPITYVENPVDAEYQSLTMSIPTSVNGAAVDTSAAPILFANSVGGYMPSSVASATEVGAGGAMMGGGAMPTADASATATSGTTEAATGSNAMLNSTGEQVSLQKLALAAGYVVVEPGCRGRTLTNDAGEYYGVAPAAIVDLKAALRYIRYNASLIPADTEKIITSGTSAGGALSALLGASGDSTLYDSYLKDLGAAEGSDAVLGSGNWCPIADLENADGAYEWCWGTLDYSSGTIDETLSSDLKALYTSYIKTQGLTYNGASLNADNYSDYLLKEFLQPAATLYLGNLSDADRETYLSENSFITWENKTATFTWDDFTAHVGTRKKGCPSFDTLDLSSGENNLFGQGTTEARHFTAFIASKTGTTLDSDIPALTQMMNPMYFLYQNKSTVTKNWWIRVGTSDVDTSLNIVGSLALKNTMLGNKVNAKMYWDAGHGSNEDAEDFITWMGEISA